MKTIMKYLSCIIAMFFVIMTNESYTYDKKVNKPLLIDIKNINTTELTFLAFKKEKRFEVYYKNNSNWKLLKKYKILAASGVLGPKLKEGDKQVPEGIYKIIQMNPKSKYHLSLLINYPNEFDLKKAKLQNRDNLGGEICIHGKAVSRGCIAIGDSAIEEVYGLVEKVGMKNVKVIISPYDFRKETKIDYSISSIPWTYELYNLINKELSDYSS